MTDAVKINYKITKGNTFSETLRWESGEKIYKPITAITQSAPLTLTATAHGIPPQWRVKISNVVGMTDINSSDIYRLGEPTTPNLITINDINSVGYRAYTSGGILEYNKPVDMTGYTAKMQIRPNADSSTLIYEMTTSNGGITIDNTTKKITLFIPSTVTSTFNFTSAVYALEIYAGTTSFVLIYGSMGLTKEVVK
jgi:hypothetical protein